MTMAPISLGYFCWEEFGGGWDLRPTSGYNP